METVIVAFENSKTAWRVKEILEGGGVASCVVCRSADQVRRTLHKLHVPAVVCGYKLGDQTAELLFDDLPLSCAMLVLASQSMLELMQNDDIFRLPTPVSRGDLAASVRMLLQIGRRLERYVRPRRSREEQSLIDQAKRLLIATGSSPSLPPIPGLKEGIEAGYLLTNREVLTLDAVPERLAIIGGGVIGLEMAAYYATAGSKVTVIEMLDHIAGATDREISAMLQKEYEKKGVTFLLSTKVVSIAEGKIACEAGGKPLEVPFDKALVSIGRRANIKGIGLENLGVVTDRAGIVTDDKMRTSVENVYATGDVTGRYMLAHTAYRESEVAINTILGKPDHMRYNANPSVIYTQPEVASVGLSEEAAKDAGIDYEVKKLSMRYAGRFVAENEGGDGICKILVDKKHRNILGVHMLGSYSSEIIWGAAEMIENELRVTDAREIIFPHPTVSEIIRETLWEFDDK